MITYTIECLPEDIEVRGNAAVSGDDAFDKEVEDSILADLERGNDWAWCFVCVTASLTVDNFTFTGTDNLGCCSYKSEKDFCKPGGYFDSMKEQARAMLRVDLQTAIERGQVAVLALSEVEK